MNRASIVLGITIALLAATGPEVRSATPDPAVEVEEPTPEATESAKKKDDGTTDRKSAADKKDPALTEVVVVTASRTEQPLHEAPTAVTVLDAEQIRTTPADDFGDYLRNVPGVNVAQIGARDIQVAGRSASSTLSTRELVLIDNRSIYLDFFGFIMWDALPLDPTEIKQIEVVRGPGSAVWGANALNGVVNILTKSPKEMPGTKLVFGGGELGTRSANVLHADVAGKLGYKVSASYYEQDPYDRPTGSVPGTAGPIFPDGTPYPPFDNKGTKQPKVNARLDYDLDDGSRWTVSSGYAGTEGIIHSGIGPFDVDTGASMAFLQSTYGFGAAQANFFFNRVRGDASNLVTRGEDGRPLRFDFATDTYSLDMSNTNVLARRHLLTYGVTARHNTFDLSIAPRGNRRDEQGVFVQNEFRLHEKLRWLVGARWDHIDPIGSVVSPRTSLMIEPVPRRHTFRLSYNRAFRAPSLVNNYLDVTIVNAVDLPFAGLYLFPSRAVGNIDLKEERLDAYEAGYVGTIAKGMTVTVSVYRNRLVDSVDFFASSSYTSADPPPDFPLPIFLLDVPPPFGLGGLLPARFTYRNIGRIVDRGVEMSLNWSPAANWSLFVNYSWQARPDVEGIEPATDPNGNERLQVNLPPRNRANVGLTYRGGRFFVGGNVNYTDDAFWTDVLDTRFWGPTDAFTQVNLAGGYDFTPRVSVSVTAQNVFDERVQQHVFGDIISRKVSGQLSLRY